MVTTTPLALEANSTMNSKDLDGSTIRSEISSPAATLESPSSIAPKYPDDKEDIVGWEGRDDPENPRNWSKKRRWIVTLVVSLFTFIRYVYST